MHARASHGAANPHRETRGDRVIRFCNTLKIPDGPEVGKVSHLRDWECNIVKEIYDETTVKRNRTVRKVREALWTMARKNSKTTNAARLVLVHGVGPETRRNAQLYSAAWDRDQAGIVYQAAANMVAMDDELSTMLRLSDAKKEIRCPLFGTKYKALTAEARSKHGFNPTLVVMDELAQFGTDRVLYDTLRTSMGAQIEALLLTISTQADSDIALMSQLVDYGRQVNAGTVEDPTFKLFEFSVPEDCENIFEEKVWYQANPGLGDFRDLDEMKAFAARARVQPSLENTFRNLYLNQRISSTTPFVSPSVWKSNGNKPTPLEEKKGRPFFAGFDLSMRKDLTALAMLFPNFDEEETFDVHLVYWTPRGTMEERSRRERVPYVEWEKLKYLTVVPGATVDYRLVAQYFSWALEEFELLAMGFDRWRMDVFKTFLEQEGIEVEQLPLIPIGQGFKDMTPCLESLEDLLLERRLVHGNNPVLTWNAASARLLTDPAGNRKFDKASESGRIDGLVALAMAARLATSSNELELAGMNSSARAGGMTVL